MQGFDMLKYPELNIGDQQKVSYCIPIPLRDEQIKLSTARIKERVTPYPNGQTREEPIAVVCFGPSLNDTWEKIKDFKYVISCSGAHKFLLDKGIIPTFHIDIDPREHKVELLGKPNKDVEYLIGSCCHPKLFGKLEDFNVKLWHAFATEEEAFRLLPHGEWALLGGSSAGLRALTMARFLGFTKLHIFGMDGSFGVEDTETKSGKHAAPHPNQTVHHALVEYSGVKYRTTPAFLECAKQTFHELDRLPDVKATFYGHGLVQTMAKQYVPNYPKDKVSIAFCKPELISKEYRALNAKLHADVPSYGMGGHEHASTIYQLAKDFNSTSVLDYGAGKQTLAQVLPFPIWSYEPAIPSISESPRPADIVACTDVLEHVELENLPYVLDDLRRCTKKVGYFVINMGPSTKTLADGRNAHMIQRDSAWWQDNLKEFFTVGKSVIIGPKLHVIVGPSSVANMDHVSIDYVDPITPFTSIIIPTYNHLDLLKKCINSITEHTNIDHCEVIVVANGCTDGTERYLESLSEPFRYVVHKDPLGFTAAINVGIKMASGDYIVLLNNDTELLSQKKNAWIEMLMEPFKKDKTVGITGPVKFSFPCGTTKRYAIAFWCAMMKRKLFTELGPLDEIFSPGTGEDGDFSIKTEQAGYKLVQIPVDGCEEFGKGIPNQAFPIFHKGSGTFGDKDYSDIVTRNSKILEARYGNILKLESKPQPQLIQTNRLDEIYKICLSHECDTNQLFPTLKSYAEKCQHITEFGVRGVFTTWAFLAARPKRMVSYDIEYCTNIEEAKDEAKKAGISFDFVHNDVLKSNIEKTELLFIDTKHTYSQLKAELEKHAGNVEKFILIHDTTSYGEVGEDDGPGEWKAIEEFLAINEDWSLKERFTISNGLTILEHHLQREIKHSIVIPTYNHFHDALKPCLDAMFACTDLSDKEVIVVANGCTDETIPYLKTLKVPIKLIEFTEPMGYIRSINAGIKAARGEFVTTLDNDSILQPQEKDQWIKTLHAPFIDKDMGATSPFSHVYYDLGHILHSGCTMYRRHVLLQIGMFDEAFNPGYMSDEDLAIRIRKAGYKLAEVPKDVGIKEYKNGIFHINFPVVHMGTVKTMNKEADHLLLKRNRDLLLSRHLHKTFEEWFAN
jgi:GT2 family glycosyltransferase